MSEKKKPLAHIDYLLHVIDTDQDKEIQSVGIVFRRFREDYNAGKINDHEVRMALGIISRQAIERCKAKYHASKLFEATIDYIINPNRKV